MTLQEVSEKYEVAEQSLIHAFPRTQKSILNKYGIKIIKKGRGKSAVYEEELIEDKNSSGEEKRASTMFQEVKESIEINTQTINLINWDFMCFLAIVTTPMTTFSGSYEEFLEYCECSITDNNIKEVKKSLMRLTKADYISYIIDKTNENYFTAHIYWQVQQDMKIGIEMIRDCRILAKKYHKRSWVPLLKTWLGVEMLSLEVDDEGKQIPFTTKDLERITGLSKYQINDSNKILKESDIYRTSRAFLTYNFCLGTRVEMNGFYTGIKKDNK